MRRHLLKTVTLFLTAIILTLVLASCNDKTSFVSPGNISKEKMQEINNAWTSFNPNGNLPQFRHYGTYNGSVILFSSGSFGNLKTCINTYADIDFVYHSDFTLYVYKNHNFLLLDEACEEGWISKADIKATADYHNGLNPPSLQQIDIKVEENTKPSSVPNDTLQVLLAAYNEKFNTNIAEMYHYGTYDGAAVFFAPIPTASSSISKEIYKGTEFLYPSKFKFITYYRGLFFDGFHSVDIDTISKIGKYHDSTLPAELQRTYVDLPENAEAGSLTDEQLTELKTAFRKFNTVEFDTMLHYGTSDGITALFIPLNSGKESTYKYNGISLTYETDFNILLYKDGMFLPIHECIEYWLDYKKIEPFLKSIEEYHNSTITP